MADKRVDPGRCGAHSAVSTRNANVPDGQHRRRFGVEGGPERLRPIGTRKVTLATRKDFGPTDPVGLPARVGTTDGLGLTWHRGSESQCSWGTPLFASRIVPRIDADGSDAFRGVRAT